MNIIKIKFSLQKRALSTIKSGNTHGMVANICTLISDKHLASRAHK